MSKYKNELQKKMEKHLIKFKTEYQYLPATNKKKWFYHDISDNIFPPIRHAFLDYAYRTGIPLHDYINHVRSSQMFAINCFFPLLMNEQKKIIDVLNDTIELEIISIDDYYFEYSPEENILGEWKSDENRPEEYVTSVDLYLVVKDKNYNICGILIEVKFTENEFTNCGGYNSGANKEETKAICYNSEKLYNDFQRCYLQGAKGKSKLNRKYFTYFNEVDFNKEKFNGFCPFIFNHQCLRNHALSRALVENDKIDYSYFVLVYHDDNEEILKKIYKYKENFNERVNEEIKTINISKFVKASDDQTYRNYMKDRYKIN